MNWNFASPIFATVLIVMFACTIAYALILREVNQGRDRSEHIGFFERARFIEVLELHKQDFPSSKKRLVLWSLTAIIPVGFTAVLILQHLRPQ